MSAPMNYLDGNAAAGELSKIFAADITSAEGQCANCGAKKRFAEAHLYIQCPGLIARCPLCGHVLLRCSNPITDDFWPIYEEYLRNERRASPDVHAVWIASRKGQGKPLRYATFESALRYIGRKAGILAHPHLFRHTLAQGVLDTTGNIKVAQEILGHSHLSTTADLYLRVDQQAMVTVLERVKSNTGRAKKHRSWPSAKAA
jgi:Family of unknown function (DUF6510)/Phage integrase family